MRVIELFAGIGACSKALERLGMNPEIVDAVEIDKYAIKSFNAIHNTKFEPQDVVEWNKNFNGIDLIMHGSPCQDFSIAGRQAGGDKDSGTRSSLLYETIRIVKNIKPKYVVWENVKNVLSTKHRHNFDNYIKEMVAIGYNSYYQILNAKDYEIPQNRERVFTISIRNDIRPNFKFPEKRELKLKLKDLLEENPDKKYYLSDKLLAGLKRNEQKQKEKGNGFRFDVSDRNRTAKTITTRIGAVRMDDNFIRVVGTLDMKGLDCIKRVYDSEGISPTLTNMQGGNRQPKIIETPCIAASRGRYNPDGSTEQNLEINKTGLSNTLTTVQKDNYVIEEKEKIRKLTPLECWRLMGFDDDDFNKAKAVPTSDTQLYKQAGNSIVVNVLENIFKELFII